jgi:hypothetical protein
MTQTQAYEQAAKTGQISMRPQTAAAFAAIARMDEAVTAVFESIAAIYTPGQDTDEISERIFDAYSGLHEEALTLLAQHIIYDSMTFTDFKGL